MSKKALEALLAELADQLGMDGLALDDNDHSILKIDDGPDLHLEYFDDSGLVVIAAALDPIPEDSREAAYAAMLKGNYLWQETAGATLAVNPADDAVIVEHKIPVSEIEPGSLQETLMGFDGLCRLWQERLETVEDETDGGADEPDRESRAHDFIRG